MKKRLLLVGWDSADWKIINDLLAEGGMEGIRQLMDGGTHGNLATLEPQLSPMLWSSIATGKMAYDHGVPGFTEVDPVSGQVVPVSAATRQCKTVWEMLGEKGLKCHVVSWFATQGEQNLNGKMVSNMFNHLKGTRADQTPEEWPSPMPGTYWPEELAETMNELRVSPHEIDGDVLTPFIPAGAEIDQDRDRRPWILAEHLAEAYSVHSAATHLMETDPNWDLMAVYYRAIDEICHHFMPYHPPQMEGIPDEDFERYQHVVNGTYRAHDMMLQRLLQLAGPETAVMLVSDHGFHSDHLRPKFTPRVPAGITVWHREQGVYLAKGPGFKQTPEPIFGARLLDITPTVLHYFGLPVGEDMEGRVLTETFAGNEPVHTIPTWEDPNGRQQRRGSLSEEESEALLQQFVALGYLDEMSSDPTQAAEETVRENKWNMARSYLYSGKHEGALPLLEDCFTTYPERTDYAQSLARTQLNLGLITEAEETLAICLESFGSIFGAKLLQGQIALQQGDYQEALDHLADIREEAADHPQLLEIVCRSCVHLGQWEQAREASDQLLELDPDSYQGRITRTRCQLQADDAAAAVDTALEAVSLHLADPRGHVVLGLALSQLEQWQEAEQALRKALLLNPDNAAATAALTTVYKQLAQHDNARACEDNAARLRAEREATQAKHLRSLREGIAARAKVRHAERQLRREAAAQKAAEEAAIKPSKFTIVSGLPRSGTSLMMQMLKAGGLELMADGKRKADEDNLEGYWEWEEVKALKKNPRLIEQAEGKVVKVISALIPHLPPLHHYKIIFMKRPVDQVVASQWKMLERSGQDPKSTREYLMQTQETHVAQTLAQLRQRQDVELIEIDFPQLVASPEAQTEALSVFMGEALITPENLASVVRPELHRQRTSNCAGS